jgi:cytochrome P450 family 144
VLGIDDRLVAEEFWRDPYPLFERLRREAPVWRLPGENAFFVSSWELVADATRRVEDFSNHFRYTAFSHDDGTLGVLETGAIGPDVFAGADPPVHTEQRKIFFAELVQKKIDAIEPFVAAVTDELLDRLFASDRGDAAAELAHPLPMRVIAERVIGFRDPDVEQIRRWMFGGSRLVGGLMTLDQMTLLSGEAAGLVPWTEAQLDAAIASPSEGDVLGAAAAAVRDGCLTHEEASFTLMVLVGAGAETTTSLIGIAIGLLAEHPHLQDELRADPTKVPGFTEEVLRFESPFRYHPRTAAHTVELDGVTIPEGALVLLSWCSANRDEAVFEQPNEIKLGRRNAHLHFGFGRGIHHCVGAPLARLEARVVLTRLLERTKSFTLDPKRAQRWSDSIWIHRHDELPVVVEPN